MHHNFDDSDSGYDVEEHNKQGGKSFGIGGYRGRVIFLGDGTEVLTDSDDTEMFDNAEEDKDLVSQVSKGSSTQGSALGATSAAQEAVGPSAGTGEEKIGGGDAQSEEDKQSKGNQPDGTAKADGEARKAGEGDVEMKKES